MWWLAITLGLGLDMWYLSDYQITAAFQASKHPYTTILAGTLSDIFIVFYFCRSLLRHRASTCQSSCAVLLSPYIPRQQVQSSRQMHTCLQLLDGHHLLRYGLLPDTTSFPFLGRLAKEASTPCHVGHHQIDAAARGLESLG